MKFWRRFCLSEFGLGGGEPCASGRETPIQKQNLQYYLASPLGAVLVSPFICVPDVQHLEHQQASSDQSRLLLPCRTTREQS